ncbi:hypothetical protein H072_1560 [Dactylellina haptotyla CBS 200.50]|uniref:Uncharacterized protein n=1 Tax=Dactylellina haptotyla (strain CBS 200.50) TaxID=1284197 RepID=S8C9V6_DACHA|nr:hypothetical protein H072_1560 [Dactylellina haptotyla CBS 200.50]
MPDISSLTPSCEDLPIVLGRILSPNSSAQHAQSYPIPGFTTFTSPSSTSYISSPPPLSPPMAHLSRTNSSSMGVEDPNWQLVRNPYGPNYLEYFRNQFQRNEAEMRDTFANKYNGYKFGNVAWRQDRIEADYQTSNGRNGSITWNCANPLEEKPWPRYEGKWKIRTIHWWTPECECYKNKFLCFGDCCPMVEDFFRRRRNIAEYEHARREQWVPLGGYPGGVRTNPYAPGERDRGYFPNQPCYEENGWRYGQFGWRSFST